MPHHLVSEVDLKSFCIYCRQEILADRWKSEWHSETHYKTAQCSCGRTLHIKVGFDGSGHDSWNGIKFNSRIIKKGNIDDRIRVLEAPKIVARHHPKK